MLVEVRVPVLAESVPDATLLTWRKQAGERVERGENIIDLETDKVTLEIAAPDSGVLVEIRKHAGDTALSQDVLAIIDTALAGSAVALPPAAEESAVSTQKLGPAARKLASAHQIDPGAVPASGKDGRVTKSDVRSYLENAPTQAAIAPPGPHRQ